MSGPIHVVLHQLPDLLAAILVQTLQSSTDFDVRIADGEESLLSGGRDEITDALITTLDEGDAVPARCRSVVRRNPRIRLFAIDGDGRNSFLYELRPQQVALGHLSPEKLKEAIRKATVECPVVENW